MRSCCSAAASMRLDHRRSNVADSAPASCGLPCGCSRDGRFHLCAAHPGRRNFAITGGIHAASVLAANTTRPTASMPSAFSAGWEQPALQEAPLTFAWRDAPIGAGRAIAGRSSSRGRRPRERWSLRVTRAGMDAGGFAKPAGRRPAITKPDPRRNFHWRAGRTAGGSERRPTDEGRAAGGGDAATRPHAAHQLQELAQDQPHGCGDGCATHRTPNAHSRTPPTIPDAFPTTPRQQQPPAAPPPAGQAPAAGGRGSVGVCA